MSEVTRASKPLFVHVTNGTDNVISGVLLKLSTVFFACLVEHFQLSSWQTDYDFYWSTV